MSPTQRRRFTLVALILTGLAVATFLGLKAYRANMMYFKSPSDIQNGDYPAGGSYRVGGMVVDGSVRRLDDGVTVLFDLTDYAASVTVRYSGILPDLFREGQGIVADGRIDGDGRFVADRVLAKHDETYMPPDVAAALKDAETPQ